MSQSNKSFSQGRKFWEPPFKRKCLRTPKTDSKAHKFRKSRRLAKKKNVLGKSQGAPRKLNLRAKNKFWRKKKLNTRNQPQLPSSPKLRQKWNWQVPTPHVLVQSQSARLQMLDYSSSIGDPQESWLWSSDDDEKGVGKREGLSELTRDDWAAGKMVNFLEVTNITQSVGDFSQWGSLFESKKSFGERVLKAEKKEKAAVSKKPKKTRKIKKKNSKTMAHSKRKSTKSRKAKTKKNPKIKDFYKVKQPAEFSMVWLKQNKKKVPFRCYPENSEILRFAKEDLKQRLVEKEQDDDCATDEEIKQDSISFMLRHLKKSLRKLRSSTKS